MFCYTRVRLLCSCGFVVAIVIAGSVAGCETYFNERFSCVSFFHLVTCYLGVYTAAAVVEIIKLPVARSSAGVAEAGLRAVWNLTSANPENKVKLGSAGGCEGWWVDWKINKIVSKDGVVGVLMIEFGMRVDVWVGG